MGKLHELAAISATPPRLWGKRLGKLHELATYPVHPHACGENAKAQSPQNFRVRYTPTPVGKTGGSAST